MNYVSMGAIFSLLLLLGAGCNSTLVSSCEVETPWESCIEDEVDEALLGEWELQEQRLSGAAGSTANPFSGRTTRFVRASLEGDEGETVTYGAYWEDYSTESAQDVQAGGLTATCEALGGHLSEGSGTFQVFQDVDLDLTQDDDDTVTYVNTLRAYEAADSSITCSAGGSAVTATTASLPLGSGPGGSDALGLYAEYTYAVSLDWQTLTIEQPRPGNLTAQWIFNRR